MLANIVISTVLLIAAMLLISDMTAFWQDRTDLGNACMFGAVVVVLAYFATGLWQLWR